MALQYLSSINLNYNTILNAITQPAPTDPADGRMGQVIYQMTDHQLKVHNGSSWVALNLSGDETIQLINTGTLKIDAKRIDGLQEMLDDVSMSGQQIIEAVNQDTTKTIAVEKITGLVSRLNDLATKEDSANKSSDALAQAKRYVDEQIKALLGTADEAHDTLGELQDLIKNNHDKLQALDGVVKKGVNAVIGDGVSTEFTVTHNLNSDSVIAEVMTTKAPYEKVLCETEYRDKNTMVIKVGSSIATGELTVKAVG